MSACSYYRWRRSSVILLLTLIVGGGICGCGADRSPVASGDLSPGYETGGQSFLVFGTGESRPAAKLAWVPEEGISAVETIGRMGGTVSVRDLNGRGREDDLRAALWVPPRALRERVDIGMTVVGNRLSELVAIFDPNGLVFEHSAYLTFALGADRLDMPLDQLKAYHIDNEGNVEEARITVIEGGRNRGDWREAGDAGVVIAIEVPGFSRYGVGNTH